MPTPRDGIRWTPDEYDVVAKAVLAAKLPADTPRHELLKVGMQALPKHRRRTLDMHLGGKSFAAFRKAMARATGVKTDIAQIKRDGAAKARAAMAAKREAMRAAGIPIKYKPRTVFEREAPDPNTLGGRIHLRLVELQKTKADLSEVLGITMHSINVVIYKGKSMRPKNLNKAAEFLGVQARWLLHGDDGVPTTVVMPQAAAVHKANGKHALSALMKTDVAMATSHRAAIDALFPLLAADVQAYVIARVAELIAMQARK